MKVIGVLMVVLALVSGILPQFTDCSSQGRAITLPNGKQIDMKCHWTARAEAAMALPLNEPFRQRAGIVFTPLGAAIVPKTGRPH